MLPLILGAALLPGSPVLAQAPIAPPEPAPNTVSGVTVTSPAKPESEDPVICRKSPETGSRVRVIKQCRKLSEWAAKAKSRKMGVDEVKWMECSGSGSGSKGCELYPRPGG
ncbi:hypothetical protein [Phenylobacterium sp.]|uniref:hypothetical protein n=1 Tax=Phenylobacterium sp. TaxID=1871053 RepID=UPI00273389CC|nr:hypothetical protein [Phenylobacterium sp.]MDP3855926.1 hypothetical protein [Phenylobacterium sp.]